MTLRVVNHTHYTLLTAVFNTLRFGGTLAPGQSQDFNDASFTPGSHVDEGFDLGHALDRSVALSLGGMGTLGTGPVVPVGPVPAGCFRCETRTSAPGIGCLVSASRITTGIGGGSDWTRWQPEATASKRVGRAAARAD